MNQIKMTIEFTFDILNSDKRLPDDLEVRMRRQLLEPKFHYFSRAHRDAYLSKKTVKILAIEKAI